MPGPDFLWSVDSYCKLVNYGFEIYAAIDTYSHYIVWLYVGISACTSVSVLRQYLDTVYYIQKFPQYLQSDCGQETPLCANAHYALQSSSSYNTEPVQFQDCYFYSTVKEVEAGTLGKYDHCFIDYT